MNLEQIAESEERIANHIRSALQSKNVSGFVVYADNAGPKNVRDRVWVRFLREQYDRPANLSPRGQIAQRGFLSWEVNLETATTERNPQTRIYGIVPHVRDALTGFDPVAFHPPCALYQISGDANPGETYWGYRMVFESAAFISNKI